MKGKLRYISILAGVLLIILIAIPFLINANSFRPSIEQQLSSTLGRGVQNVHIAMNREQWPNIDIMTSLYFSEGLIIGMLLLGAWKYGKLKHPATWLAVAVNVFNLFIEPIGSSEVMQSCLKALIKG